MIKVIEINETVAVNVDTFEFEKAFHSMLKEIGGGFVDIAYSVKYMGSIRDIISVENKEVKAFNINFSIYFSDYNYSIGRKISFSSLEIKNISDYKIEVKNRINTIYSILSSIVHELKEKEKECEEFNPFMIY